MKEPRFLPPEVILATHEMLLARFGGASGIRDEGLLESAMGRPKQLANYGTPSVFELAASYAFGIVKNHPFVDGNKRTGFMAAFGFLGANGYALKAPEAEAVIRTLSLAAGETSEAEYSAWLESASVARP